MNHKITSIILKNIPESGGGGLAPILGGEGCNPPTGDGVDLTLGDLVFGDFRDFDFSKFLSHSLCMMNIVTF